MTISTCLSSNRLWPIRSVLGIAAALALASGKTQAPVSLSDRLAALKSPKQG